MRLRKAGRVVVVLFIGVLCWLSGHHVISSAGSHSIYLSPMTNWHATDVVVAGHYAYVTTWSNRLHILDVSDVDHPREVSTYVTPGHAMEVTVIHGYAYVADREAGLRIIDVRDPRHPNEVGSVNTSNRTYGVVVKEGYAYIADWYGGLRIIDVRDPTHPRPVSVYSTPGPAHGVDVAGRYAFVAVRSSGLVILDVSDLFHPRKVGQYIGAGEAVKVKIVGHHAYTAYYHNGVRVIDIQDVSSPREVGHYDTPGYVYDLSVAPPYIYVADEIGGVRIIDAHDIAHLREVKSYKTPGRAYGITVVKNFVYVADGNVGLVILPGEGPAPANDRIEGAIVIPPSAEKISWTYSQDTTNAMTDSTEPLLGCRSTNMYHTVWYEFSPKANGTFNVDTTGSNYDTIVGIWEVNDSFIPIGCDDNGGVGRTSSLSVNMIRGRRYYIEVGGATAQDAGLLNLRVQFDPLESPRSWIPLTWQGHWLSPCLKYEPNDNRHLNPWGPLRFGVTYRAYLCRNDYEDNYYFQVPAAGQVRVRLQLPPSLVGHTALWVYWEGDLRSPISGVAPPAEQRSNITLQLSLSHSGKYIVRLYTEDSTLYYDESEPYRLRVEWP